MLPANILMKNPIIPDKSILLYEGRYRNAGKCQQAHPIVKNSVATKALYRLCKAGKTYPLHPISSPKPNVKRFNKKYPTIESWGNSLLVPKPLKVTVGLPIE